MQGFSEHRTADAKHDCLPRQQDHHGQPRATAVGCLATSSRGCSSRRKFDNVFLIVSPDTKAFRKSLARQKQTAAVASACKENLKGKAKGTAKWKANVAPVSSGGFSVASVAAMSLVEDMVGTSKHNTECLAETTST